MRQWNVLFAAALWLALSASSNLSAEPLPGETENGESKAGNDSSDDRGRSDFYLPEYQSELPEVAVDAVWKLIDTNQDNRGTDKELDAAVRPLRRLANHPDATPARDAIRARFDADGSEIVDKEEAIVCLCEVRGIRCPSAAQAFTYWKSLDQDENNSVNSAEFSSLLTPLGKVGEAMAPLLSNTLKRIDRNGDHAIEELEVYYSANTVLRIQMATVGRGIANRDPSVWINFVRAVSQMDLDADNFVSPTEALAMRSLASRFNKVDRNRDQQLSVSEICDYRQHIEDLIAAARSRSFSGSC